MAVPLLRTLILYCAVICAVRLMGKRQIGELDPSELVVTILVSDLAAVPMQDLGIPLLSGLVPIAQGYRSAACSRVGRQGGSALARAAAPLPCRYRAAAEEPEYRGRGCVPDDARRLRQHVPAEKGGPCMKRLLTAAVLCTVLILGSVWSVRAVDNTAQAVALDVENDRLNEARETWDAAQTLLGALLLHSEIDQADRLFDRVLAAQQNGLTDEFSLDRAELLAQLRHLPEVQRPTLKNLF